MKDGDDGMEFAFRLETCAGLRRGRRARSPAAWCATKTARCGTRAREAAALGKLVLSVLTDLGGVANDGVQHPQLKEAVRAQLPHDPATGRDRRGERIERAFESLIGSGFLVVSGTTIRLKQ
jgi:hypothetical protein